MVSAIRAVVAPHMKPPQKLQGVGHLGGRRVECGPLNHLHRIETAGLCSAVAVDILPKCKESLVAQGEEWPAQRREDPELIVGPFDRGDGVAKGDDLLAIMKRTPTHKDVRDAPCFQRTDV